MTAWKRLAAISTDTNPTARMASANLPLEALERVRLVQDADTGAFDCGDTDLNEFLATDSKTYLRELMAVTYLFRHDGRTVAFYSVANDKLTCDPGPKPSIWKLLESAIPKKKQRRYYPSVKLGRLGVCRDYQSSGLGTQILDHLKVTFITNNRTGCRFITVDAYNNTRSLNFYMKNGFAFLREGDEKVDTRLMYFDLKPFHDLQHPA
ncbi:MAG: GNAT family N-acetyltransferase [bacterium]